VRIILAEEGIPGSERTVVCLGFFDGVHIGHARLVERAAEKATRGGFLACVHTFDQMPAKVVRPGFAVRELTPLAEKAALLGGLGVDVVAVSRFDEAMMHMAAEDFFRHTLVEKLRAAHVVAGFHYRFGFREAAGTRELAALCGQAGIGLTIMEPVTMPDGRLVSSTAIRALLDAGDIPLAEAMLGRPFKMIRGE